MGTRPPVIPLITMETVARDTPASLATSCCVGRLDFIACTPGFYPESYLKVDAYLDLDYNLRELANAR